MYAELLGGPTRPRQFGRTLQSDSATMAVGWGGRVTLSPSRCRRQLDRPFWTGRHTQTAGMTVGATHDERLPVAVNACLDASEPGQAELVGWGQRPDLEDVIRAHVNAVTLRFTARTVDHRDQRTCGFAVSHDVSQASQQIVAVRLQRV
jgi:hypothetical protein